MVLVASSFQPLLRSVRCIGISRDATIVPLLRLGGVLPRFRPEPRNGHALPCCFWPVRRSPRLTASVSPSFFFLVPGFACPRTTPRTGINNAPPLPTPHAARRPGCARRPCGGRRCVSVSWRFKSKRRRLELRRCTCRTCRDSSLSWFNMSALLYGVSFWLSALR